MKRSLPVLMALAMLIAIPAMAADNPCNPCSMKHNPCNPCSMKKGANPCNPCSMKHDANPCSMKKSANPCNPCSMKKNANPCNPCAMKGAGNPCNPKAAGDGPTLTRPHAFNSFQQAAELGRRLWNDASLGTSGVACMDCHGDYDNLHLDQNRNFPHYVNMVGDVVSLDQMINFCMVNPMKGKQFEPNSKELTAMTAYFRAYRMQYLREQYGK